MVIFLSASLCRWRQKPIRQCKYARDRLPSLKTVQFSITAKFRLASVLKIHISEGTIFNYCKIETRERPEKTKERVGKAQGWGHYQVLVGYPGGPSYLSPVPVRFWNTKNSSIWSKTTSWKWKPLALLGSWILLSELNDRAPAHTAIMDEALLAILGWTCVI